MRKSLGAAAFVLMVMAIWFASFWTTRARAIENWQQDNPVWMQNVPTQIVDTEQDFRRWVESNTQALQQQRLALGRLLEDPQTTDTAVWQQAEIIAQTHEELLRAVAQHIMTMQSELPDSQKALLSGFCLQTLRGGCGGQQHNRPEHAGQGLGNGFRRGRRQGQSGLTQRLDLTDEQLAIATEKDPTFETDVRRLQTTLAAERQSLPALIENQETTDEQVSRQIDRVISAHHALEKRLIGYVLTMREHLTAEQKSRLFGLCRRNCSRSQATESRNNDCRLNP